MSSVHPTTVGLTASSHLHDPENPGSLVLHRLTIYRIIQLFRHHDDLEIVEKFDSEADSSSVDGVDGASNHGNQNNQNTPGKYSSSPLSHEQKIKRIVDAIMGGRHLRFSPLDDDNGYTVYDMGSPRPQHAEAETESEETDEAESEDELEQQISAYPQNFGQVLVTLSHTVAESEEDLERQISAYPQNFGQVLVTPSNTVTPDPTSSSSRSEYSQDFRHIVSNIRRPACPYPRSSASGSVPGSVSGSTTPQDTGDVTVNTCRPQTPYPIDSALYESSSDEKFHSILDWRTNVQKATSGSSKVDGRHLVIMGQAGVEHHTISPIPFNIHKKARTTPGTPSISSHGSILDCSSPSFAQTCKALTKQSYLDLAASLGPGATASRVFIIDREHGGGLDLPDIGSDPGGPEDIDVWVDIESGDEDDENKENVDPNANVLKDTTNLRRPGYLQHNSFYQDAKAKAKNAATTHIGGPLPTAQHQPSIIAPPNSVASSPTSFFTTHGDSEHNTTWATAFAGLEGVVISDSPDIQAPLSLGPRPPSLSRTLHIEKTLAALEERIDPISKSHSLEGVVIPDSLDTQAPLSLGPRSPSPSRTLHIEKTLAALEGCSDPISKSPSPVQRSVRPGSNYSHDVLVENLGPRLRHPQPAKTFFARALLAKMEAKLIGRNTKHSAFPEGRLIERPSNPTPCRARVYYDEQNEGRGAVPGRQLVRKPANPTSLRARYLYGEGSSA